MNIVIYFIREYFIRKDIAFTYDISQLEWFFNCAFNSQ